MDVGKRLRPGAKLYTETIFCSDRVAGLLRAMPLRSAVHAAFPDSFIGPRVAYETGFTLGEAARFSYTDPYLVPLAGPYLTGAVNELTAYDVARLAREVTVRYPPQWGRIDGALMRKFFGHDPWDATERFTSLFADRWVDTSDRGYESLGPTIGFAPTPRALATFGLRLKTNVPKLTRERFVAIIAKQEAYGHERYTEVVVLPPNIRRTPPSTPGHRSQEPARGKRW